MKPATEIQAEFDRIALAEAHGRDDRYVSIREARRICADLLPGAKVTRHLLWRYSIVWTEGNA